MYCVAILIILMVSALVFPIVFLLSLTPAVRQMIALVAFAVVTLCVELIVFVQKVYRVLKGVKVGGNMSVLKKELNEGTCSAGDISESALKIADAADLAKRRPQEAVVICNEQVQKWQALLVRLQTAVDAELRSSSKSGFLSFTASMRVTTVPRPQSQAESEGSRYRPIPSQSAVQGPEVVEEI